MKMGMSL
jgi:hypothetical protein